MSTSFDQCEKNFNGVFQTLLWIRRVLVQIYETAMPTSDSVAPSLLASLDVDKERVNSL